MTTTGPDISQIFPSLSRHMTLSQDNGISNKFLFQQLLDRPQFNLSEGKTEEPHQVFASEIVEAIDTIPNPNPDPDPNITIADASPRFTFRFGSHIHSFLETGVDVLRENIDVFLALESSKEFTLEQGVQDLVRYRLALENNDQDRRSLGVAHETGAELIKSAENSVSTATLSFENAQKFVQAVDVHIIAPTLPLQYGEIVAVPLNITDMGDPPTQPKPTVAKSPPAKIYPASLTRSQSSAANVSNTIVSGEVAPEDLQESHQTPRIPNVTPDVDGGDHDIVFHLMRGDTGLIIQALIPSISQRQMSALEKRLVHLVKSLGHEVEHFTLKMTNSIAEPVFDLGREG